MDEGASRQRMRLRLSDYLRREARLSDTEADRHAGEVLAMLGTLGTARALVDHWWLFVVRGVLAILFGILALIQPLAALAALVLVFGVWALVDGISALVLAISGWRSWQLVLAGLVGVAVGLFTFFRPGITAIGLYAAFAAWSIARGILEITVAVELRREIQGEPWLILGGIASILFGALLIVLPAAGVLAVAWLIGFYALVFGAIMCVLGIRLERARRPARPSVEVHAPTPQPTY